MSNTNGRDLKEFITSLKPIYSRPEGNPLVDGVRELTENPDIDMISYIFVDAFKFTKVNVLPDSAGKRYYYDYNIVKDCDVIYGIAGYYSMRPNTFSLSIIISGVEYPAGKVSDIFVAGIKTDPIIFRVTFMKRPDPADWFQIQIRKYLLNSILKKELEKEPVINTQSLRYGAGTAKLRSHLSEQSLSPFWETTGPHNVKTAADIVTACNSRPPKPTEKKREPASLWDFLKPNQG